MTDIKIYALDEVANILKVTRRTLYTYVNEGKLKAVKIGKYWRVSEEALKHFISTGTPVADANRRKEHQQTGR
jgi:excisionase family DNA binding protein